MYTIFLGIHTVTCLLLILTVLLQSGKGAGLNLFGGGGETLFSAPSGSSFMRQFTAGLAITFGFTSLFLTLFAGQTENKTVTNRYMPPPVQQQQAEPESGAHPVKPGEAIGQPKAETPAPAPAKTAVPAPAKK